MLQLVTEVVWLKVSTGRSHLESSASKDCMAGCKN